MTSPIQIKPEQVASEVAALGEKIARGATLFAKLRDDDVAIATTPKDEVWRQDKVSLPPGWLAEECPEETCAEGAPG